MSQELQALIKYIQINKASDSDWFTITSSKDGVHWSGKCWWVPIPFMSHVGVVSNF